MPLYSTHCQLGKPVLAKGNFRLLAAGSKKYIIITKVPWHCQYCLCSPGHLTWTGYNNISLNQIVWQLSSFKLNGNVLDYCLAKVLWTGQTKNCPLSVICPSFRLCLVRHVKLTLSCPLHGYRQLILVIDSPRCQTSCPLRTVHLSYVITFPQP